MNRRLFIFVIILMGISLGGIILLQVFWISNAIKLREDHFNIAVSKALKETVEKLESRENMVFLSNKIAEYSDSHTNTIVYGDPHGHVKRVIDPDSNATSISYTISTDNENDVVVEVWNEKMPTQPEQLVEYKYHIGIDSVHHEIATLKANINLDSIDDAFIKEVAYIHELNDSIIIGPDEGYLVIKRAENLNRAFIKMAYEFESSSKAIKDRINKGSLVTALAESLVTNGLIIPFEYGIVSIDSTTVFPITSDGFNTEDLDMDHTIGVFQNELQDESHYLTLQFPGRNMHILKSMIGILIASLLLTLIILATFGITLYMILRQKKLSDIKSDFINNMTHEFKTPIATISLATDSITNPKIITKEKEVRYYADIIREENQRMNNQVESVLRMSLLDKHELEFNFIDSDIHCLIEKAVAKLELQLEERKAKVDLKLDAKDPLIHIDPDHFTNAVLNLLDNALKYSENEPIILITTSDTSKEVAISVADNGIGMGREVQSKIFDKFYRKPSGNIHNIKGFGLGLSYVKAVLDAFKGDIKVNSETGKGSTFTISIPRK